MGVNVGASLMCCSYAKYSTVDVYSIRSRVPSTSLSWSFIIHMHTQTSLLFSPFVFCTLLCLAGKQSVPVFKIRKEGNKHTVVDMVVKIMLEGDVSKSWTDGDNCQVSELASVVCSEQQ